MSDFLGRIRWLTSGADEDPDAAFDWVSGRPGSRPNREGLRSVVRVALVLALLCLLVDWLVLARHDGRGWPLFAVLHLFWAAAFVGATAASVAYLETVDGRPMRGLGGPNTITLGRAVLVPPLVYLLATRDFGLAFFAYGVLVLSDVADGVWARRKRARSKLGIVLDPVADLFLHGAVFLTLGIVGLLPRVAIALIAARTALLVIGSGVLHFRKGSVRIQPTPLGKATGLLLGFSTALLLALAGFAPGRYPDVIEFLGALLTLLLALLVLHAVAIGIVNLEWRKPWLKQRRATPEESEADLPGKGKRE